jgi:hypothetical protein
MIVEIDPEHDHRWDALVEKHPYGWICHLSSWKKILEEHFPHMKGHYLALIENEEIKAGLPIFEVRSWILRNRFVSVPFASLCDPLVSSEIETGHLVKAALDLAAEMRCPYMEIRTLKAGEFILDERFVRSNFCKHHFLSLEANLEEIRKGFHRTCVRQRIARAQKSGLSLRVGETEEDLAKFYALHLLTRKRVNLPPQPYGFFLQMWRMFSSTGKLELMLVETEKVVVAGLILLKFRDRVSAEFAGSDETFKEMSPNHLLFSEAIGNAHREGYRVFDFGRTSPTNSSLMDFKRQWGTTVVDLPQFTCPKMELLREDWKGHWVPKELCRRLPEPLFEKFGNLCYRHLG